MVKKIKYQEFEIPIYYLSFTIHYLLFSKIMLFVITLTYYKPNEKRLTSNENTRYE